MVRPTFLIRRTGSAWLLVSCLMATVLVTSALVSALVSFYVTALPATVRTELARSGPLEVSVTGEPAGSPAAQASQVGRQLAAAFGPVPEQFYQADWSDELSLPGAQAPGAVPTVQAAALSGVTRYAVLTSGTWPGPPRAGQPIGVALPGVAAADLKLGIGSVLQLRDLSSNVPVRLQVTGLFRRRDAAAPYWGLDAIGASGRSNIGGFDTFGPAIVSPAALGPGAALTVNQVSYLALAQTASIQPAELTGLASRVTAMAASLPSAGSLVVSTSLPQTLDNAAAGLNAAKALVVISGLQLLLLSGAALILASRLLASHRDEETALLTARGAARWQLIRPSLSEAVIAVGAAATAGVLAGSQLAAALLSGVTGSQQRLPALIPAAWVAGSVLAVFCLAIVLWPVLRQAGITAIRIRRGRQAAVASATAAGVDVVLIVLAVLAVRELHDYSAAAHVAGGGDINPVIAIAPALALAGLAIIPLRLLPAAARALERLTARARRLGAAMANWEISRRPLRQSGPALLVILAVATSTLALAQYQSWQQSVRDQADYAAGAPVRVTLAQPESLAHVGRVTELPGVTSAVPASQVSLGATAQLLVLGTPQAARTVTLRSDLTPVPESQLFSSIAPVRPAGLALAGRPDRLQVTASMTGGPGRQLGRVTATIIVADAYGLAYQFTTNSMPADGQLHGLVAQLADGRSGAAYPLHLIGLSLNYAMPSYATATSARSHDGAGVIRIAGISDSPATAGPFGPAFASGQALAGWNHNISAGFLQVMETDIGGSESAVAPNVLTVSHSGAGIQVGFETGNGPDLTPAQRNKFAFGVMPAAIELDIPASRRPVPVIATASYASSASLRGTSFPVTIDGVTIACIVRATVSGFPGGASLVASQGAIEQALTSQGDGGTLSAQSWWLGTAGGAVPPGLPPHSAVTDAAAAAQALRRNTLSAAPVQGALAVAVAAALLAALGFCVNVAASARARRSQRALLAALGVPPAAQARLFCLEELMVSVPAALVGLGIGVGLAYVLIPSMTLTATAGLPVPPVLVRFPVGWVAVVALLAPAIPVLAAMISALRQPDPAAQLRAAEAAG